MLTLDARNHGGSPHSPVMTYEAMSLDVQQLLAHLGIAKCIVLGHSMGGKTAMALALQRVGGRLRPVVGAGRVAGRCGKGVATTRWGVTPEGARGWARGALRWGRRRLEAFEEPCREPCAWPRHAEWGREGSARVQCAPLVSPARPGGAPHLRRHQPCLNHARLRVLCLHLCHEVCEHPGRSVPLCSPPAG